MENTIIYSYEIKDVAASFDCNDSFLINNTQNAYEIVNITVNFKFDSTDY